MAQQQQRYRVIEKIAAGGMAEVFRAESAGLEGFKKTVAIKRVLPHLSQKKEFIGMFLDEARLSATLSHSNVVQVFDIGVGDDTYFIVMEYVDGANLKAIIDQRKLMGQPMALETACLIGLKICEGLAYAHEARDDLGQPLGIVHRDVSPPNVLVTAYGEVKVVDFGLAKANSQLESSEPGVIKGKFSYLSPESALGEKVDHRTDIFATGIIVWEMITGQRLFMGDTDLATVRQVQAANIPPLSQYVKDVPPGLEHAMAQALAKDPRSRYQSARDFGRDLNRVMFGLQRPVSSFDLAGLVTDVRAEERRRKGARPRQQTLIGSLIQDAMMSFTSLQSESKGEPSAISAADEKSNVGAIPLNFGAFEATPSPIHSLQNEASQAGLPTDDLFSAGNLAALEDHEPSDLIRTDALLDTGPSPFSAPSYDPDVLVPRHHSSPSGPGDSGAPSEAPPSPTRTFLLVFTVLVLVGGGLALHFAGIFS